VLSAVGLMCAPPQVDLVRSWPGDDLAGLDAARRRLADEAAAQLGGADEVETSIDCRYEGQSHELTVADLSSFHAEHERRNGYTRPDWPVEVTAIRARARRRARLDVTDLPAVPRPTGAGPTVLAEDDCTVWVPEGWRARLGDVGALILERTS
jgi:N-methylhydantoinase A/oxoprolinase/acetone carboxylase beta subunit